MKLSRYTMLNADNLFKKTNNLLYNKLKMKKREQIKAK